MALAFSEGQIPSLTNSSLASMNSALIAPFLSARATMSSLDGGCPTLIPTAMTSRLYFSWSHLIATDVSSPPE